MLQHTVFSSCVLQGLGAQTGTDPRIVTRTKRVITIIHPKVKMTLHWKLIWINYIAWMQVMDMEVMQLASILGINHE